MHLSSWTVAATVLVVACALPSVAQAQDAGTRDAEARALFQAGSMAYAAGRYEDALESFERAYQLSPRPDLLYNLGQACDRLRMDETALGYFRSYLAEAPSAEREQEVRARIAVLERAVAERAELAARATAPAVVAAEPDPRPEVTVTADAEAAPHRGDAPDLRVVDAAAEVTAPPAVDASFGFPATVALATLTGAALVATIVVALVGRDRFDALASTCGREVSGCADGDIAGVAELATATNALIGVTAVLGAGTAAAVGIEIVNRPGEEHASLALRGVF